MKRTNWFEGITLDPGIAECEGLKNFSRNRDDILSGPYQASSSFGHAKLVSAPLDPEINSG